MSATKRRSYVPVKLNINYAYMNNSVILMLAIPQHDLDTHQLAEVLGSPLEAGQSMYIDL